MPAAPVISAPTGDQTFITFRYDPTNNAHMGDRTITCTVTATDATDSPVSDSVKTKTSNPCDFLKMTKS